MRWDDLRYFLTVARAGNLARAGRELKVDATTVGRRVTALEQDLGAVLFTRGQDGWRLTDEGAQIVPAVEAMERQTQLVAKTVTGSGTPSGPVRIATTDDFAFYFLAGAVGRMRDRYPQIEIELITGDRLVDLGRGEADLAFRFARPGETVPVVPSAVDHYARRVTLLTMGFYVSQSYVDRRGLPDESALGSDGPGGHDLVLPAPSAGYLPGAPQLEALRARNRVAVRVDSMAAGFGAVLAGLGIGAFPDLFAARFPLIRLAHAPAVPGRMLWSLVTRDLGAVPRVRVTREFLEEEIQRAAGPSPAPDEAIAPSRG